MKRAAIRGRVRRSGRSTERGLTLIELIIAIAVAAMAVAIAVGGINSVTNASLKSTALELSGTIKFAYDRAIMARHTERLTIDMEKGVYSLDYTEDQYALSREKDVGREGDKAEAGEGGKSGKKGKRAKQEDSFFDDKAKEKDEVKQALEGGKAIQFQPDTEIAEPKTIPSGVRISKVWTGHQEEAFTSGTAYLHFFNSGWSEPAQIELTDGDGFITLKVYPLTGRVRMYDKELEVPKSQRDDGRDEGDE